MAELQPGKQRHRPEKSWVPIAQIAGIAILGLALFGLSGRFVYAQGVSPDASTYDSATEAYARGDYQTAADAWLVESYEGSVDAQFNLGVMYIEGKGVPQSRDQAMFWFAQAARAGHVEAQYNLGHLHLEDLDDPESMRAGLEWWRQAATRGFGIAQFNYGRALFYGIGTGIDLGASKFWMEQSADNGERVAIRFLQENAETFDHIEPDYSLALTLVGPEKQDKVPAPVQPVSASDIEVADTQPEVEPGQAQPYAEPSPGIPASEEIASSNPVTDVLESEPALTVTEQEPLSPTGSEKSWIPEPPQSTASEPLVVESADELTVDQFVAALGNKGSGLDRESVETTTPAQPVHTVARDPDAGEQLQSTIEVTSVDTDRAQFVDEFVLVEIRVDSRNDQDRLNDNAWLYAQPAGNATYELVRIKNRRQALDFLAALDGQGKFFSSVENHYRWYFILVGSFTDSASANEFLRNMPAWAASAELKSFQDLQISRCAQAPLLEPYEAGGLDDFCRNY